MATIGIYKITNPKGKIYIGQSTNIEDRFKHYYSLHCKGQPKIYNSLKKYGPKNHIFEIIERCNISNLIEKENFYKKEFNTLEKGLNCRFDGKGGYDSKETKERKRLCKLGNQHAKGHKKSKNTKKLISQKMKKFPFYKNKNRSKKLSKSKSIKIYQYTLDDIFIKEWESAKQAAINLNPNKINGSDIRACIRGEQKTAYGFKWEEKKH